MKIGIDIDDTIADTYNTLFPYAQKYNFEELNREVMVNTEELTTHRYIEHFHSWTKEETNQFFQKYYEVILKEIKVKTYAKEVIAKLKQEGHQIYIITARFQFDSVDVEELTKNWLDRNGIQYDELMIEVNDKDIVAKEKKLDIFIDDSYFNCNAVAKVGVQTYMMDFVVNRNLKENGYKRVYSWPHVYYEITNLGGK